MSNLITQLRLLFRGIVNSIYLSKVSDKHRGEVKKGDLISINREYLENALDTIELNFSLIAFEIWKNKKKEDNSRNTLLVNIISENVVNKNWKLVKGHSIFLGNDSCASNWCKMFSKINIWLSYKRDGRFNEVKENVIKEDFSVCTLDFQVCQQALLDNKERVFELMKQALESNALDFERIESWPVFDEFREDELYFKLKSIFSPRLISESSNSDEIISTIGNIEEEKKVNKIAEEVVEEAAE